MKTFGVFAPGTEKKRLVSRLHKEQGGEDHN